MSNDSPVDSATDEEVTFDSLPLSDEVKSAVAELGYTHPTPVQRAVFEFAARGRDLVVQARTGTGKTSAFGLPLVDRLVKRRLKEVQALVLCPTRELALQVTRELSALSKNTGLSILPVYGGAPMVKQIEGLKDGAQILVGTPGRVLDHLRRGTFDASKVRAFTLDECDEMLSMGFLPQISEIWNQLPKQLQVLLFSATVPRAVLRVAESRLKEPHFVTLSGDQVGALEIDHYVYISQGDKTRELLRILKAESPDSAIIFCNTRDDTQRVAQALQKEGYKAAWLNADLSQNERESVMKATRDRELPFLVCTDVAARGIDISHLTHVINFDFPESNEQYVHRTGRTGRAGKTGTAISLVNPGSIGNLYYLRLEYKIHPLERQLPSDQELQTRAETDAVRQLVAAFPKAESADLSLARRLLTHDQGETVVAALLRAHLTATEPSSGDTVEPTAAKLSRPSRSQAPRNITRAPRPVPSEPEDSPSPEASAPKAHSAAKSREAKRAEPGDGAARRAPKERNRRASEPPKTQPEATVAQSAPAAESLPHQSAGEKEDRAERPARNNRPRPAKPRASSARTVTEDGFSYEVRPMDDSTLPEESQVSEGEGDGAAADEARTSRREATTGSRRPARSEPPFDGDVDEVFVNIGRDDRVKTAELRSALASAEVAEGDIAYVKVRQRHTFIGVRAEVLQQAVEGLSGQVIAGKAVAAEQARPRQPRN